MPRSVNNIGTKYIGASDRQADGSFVTTEWFCFIYPLIPLKSFRVLYLDEKNNFSESIQFYNVLEKIPLDKKQVLKVYGSIAIQLIAVILTAFIDPTLSMIVLVGGAILLYWTVFKAK